MAWRTRADAQACAELRPALRAPCAPLLVAGTSALPGQRRAPLEGEPKIASRQRRWRYRHTSPYRTAAQQRHARVRQHVTHTSAQTSAGAAARRRDSPPFLQPCVAAAPIACQQPRQRGRPAARQRGKAEAAVDSSTVLIWQPTMRSQHPPHPTSRYAVTVSLQGCQRLRDCDCETTTARLRATANLSASNSRLSCRQSQTK